MKSFASVIWIALGSTIFIAVIGPLVLTKHQKISVPKSARSDEATIAPECTIHITHEGQQDAIALRQTPAPDWPVFSNEAYSFAYPPNWSVSSNYSPANAKYASYVFPRDNPKTQLGIAITASHKTAPHSEIIDDIPSFTSPPIERLNCIVSVYRPSCSLRHDLTRLARREETCFPWRHGLISFRHANLRRTPSREL